MSHTRSPELLIFHRSAPMTCPYLAGRVEQQLFTELSGAASQPNFDRLSQAGFRRSHHIAYRPVCRGCQACVPVRIAADRFEWPRSLRRVWNANADLTAEDVGLDATQEQFDLFRRYVTSRHGDGDMAQMNARDYVNLVRTSPVKTSLIEFRDVGGALVAACLADRLSDGLSAVYSFFEPTLARRSPGSFMILWLVREAQRAGVNHVYLGFWIENSRKMSYKSRYRPLEGFVHGEWRPVEELTDRRNS